MKSPPPIIALAEFVRSHPRIFRIGDIGSLGRDDETGGGDKFRSGFDALDQELPGGGWSRPGLTEILCNHTGIGELSLLMKGLSSKTNTVRPGNALHILWVMPHTQTWIPYAPALAQCGIDLGSLAIVRARCTDDVLWAAEQGLKSGACRVVLLRINETYCNPLSLRRLLQAAIAGGSAALLMRPLAAASSPSPAGTRIALYPEAGGVLRMELLKRRGLPPGRAVRVVVREMVCLRRVPAAVPDTKSTKSNAAITTPDWLENIVSGTASHYVQLRTRMLDPNRR